MSFYFSRARRRRRNDDDEPYARVELRPDGGLDFFSSWNEELKDALKYAIPAAQRSWVPARKCWAVAPQQGDVLVALVRTHMGLELTLPANADLSATQITETLDVRYIGRVKVRADGTETASGWTDNGWNAVFPGSVLKAWFHETGEVNLAGSLYSALGISTAAGPDELRKAHRRAAKTWHPDVCREDNAEENFRRIQRAYEVLSDPAKRSRYDAGLQLQLRTGESKPFDDEYRTPLLCGLITVRGTRSLGRFLVDDILDWDDIVDRHGRTLVTSWSAGAEHFVEFWT